MSLREPNAYSSEWFRFFHADIPAARTARETAFIRQACPLPVFARVLDVCCGMQTFTLAQMDRLAASVGLRLTTSRADFSATVHPSPDSPRVHFILERI